MMDFVTVQNKKHKLHNNDYHKQWWIQVGKGAAAHTPPIDWMHLETSENFAPKCMIFA